MFKDMLKPQLTLPEQIADPRRRDLINRGQVLHYLLAEIDPFTFLENPSSYTQEVKDTCRLFNYSDSSEIIQYLSDFFHNSDMQQFFNPRLKAFNEKGLVDQYGNLKRIDRLIFTDDKILIIDYKTGEEYRKEHQEQIKEYARLISQFYPGKSLEGWLIYIDSKKTVKCPLRKE